MYLPSPSLPAFFAGQGLYPPSSFILAFLAGQVCLTNALLIALVHCLTYQSTPYESSPVEPLLVKPLSVNCCCRLDFSVAVDGGHHPVSLVWRHTMRVIQCPILEIICLVSHYRHASRVVEDIISLFILLQSRWLLPVPELSSSISFGLDNIPSNISIIFKDTSGHCMLYILFCAC